MDTTKTLQISISDPLPARIRVAQVAEHPNTMQLGSSMTLNNTWDLMLEMGSNYEDASMLVFSANYRF